MHDVHAGVQGREQRILGIIKDVGGRQKCALQSGAVAEEVVAEVDEVSADVGAVEVCGGCAVGDEFAKILAEAASEVEEGGAVLETGYERGVVGGFGDTEVEETECADARVGIDFPGTFALEGVNWWSGTVRCGRAYHSEDVGKDRISGEIGVFLEHFKRNWR